MIDRTALLATLKPLVSDLEDSIRARAVETPDVSEQLEREHHRAVVAERTAMSLEEWRDGEITQAAVAWVLGCVFVRFLEDNGLVDQALISGPGGRGAAALGHREEHFRAHPAHSDREYLGACFGEVAKYPAVAPLYDERHNPVWRLSPTADGARALRETFTAIDPDSGALVHDFTDTALDTRFLGDLYQDLSDAAKKRYALLQTPEFIERFILDRTLDPAIQEFGLEEVRLIDPTCGSGHFLIGAFHRLFAWWQEREPATAATVLAQRCLDQVAGVDLNPYATAIARFRLVVAALQACGIARLAEAPALRLNLAAGDSLLHGPLPTDGASMVFDANRLAQNIAHVYETEDAAALKEILGRGYHAVVGNPPYIQCSDEALRAAYRTRYGSAYREFALTVPFMERFFELAQSPVPGRAESAGFVGKITGNAFLKREFGAPLVERYLPSVDLTALMDLGGAYIPGHGTPTVLIFGRSRRPVEATVRVVEGLEGEPSTPADPAKGRVWTSVCALSDQRSAQDRFTRVFEIDRGALARFPVILGPGRTLIARLAQSRARTVSSIAADIGYTGQTNIDDVMLRPRRAWQAAGVADDLIADFVVGDEIRDWAITPGTGAWFPYQQGALLPEGQLDLRALWPWRTSCWARRTFAKRSYREEGRPWFEWHQVAQRRQTGTFSLAWSFVATHNHFAIGSGTSVFNRSAPFIKLPQSADQDDYAKLAGVLNSALVCCWIKQVSQNRGSTVDAHGARQRTAPFEDFYELSVARVGEIPLPAATESKIPATLAELAKRRRRLLEEVTPASENLAQQLEEVRREDDELTRRMIFLQEELDWSVLVAFGLVPDDCGAFRDHDIPLSLGERAFEIVLAKKSAEGEVETTWFDRHGAVPIRVIPDHWPAAYRDVVSRRLGVIETDLDVGLIERPEHKRRWNRPQWAELEQQALTRLVLDAVEATELWSDLRPRSAAELTDGMRSKPAVIEALERLALADKKDADLASTVERLVISTAVPRLAAQRLTDAGLRKREVWERVWELQRAEDRGQHVDSIPIPPKYSQVDFRSATYWKHRGKLDVPNERFVLIPYAELGADRSAVVGWAGWNDRDLARAIAGRATELRQVHAAEADRIIPLLAGVLELLPWIHWWHPDPEPLFGGPPGAFFESWLDGELASLSVTRDTLRAWRPPAPTQRRKAKASTA